MYSATAKRRRTSMSSSASLASRGDDDTGSVDMDYQPDAKRKKIIKLDPIEQCQQLYDIIRNHKREDGTLLCEPFIRAPKRRQEPGYYEVVSNPMDMIRIQQKIKLDEYDDLEQMSADVDLMVTNAKAFYKRSTQEYKDACDLWELFVEKKSVLFDQEGSAEEGEKKGKIILKMGKLARRAAAVESRKPTVGEIDGGETSESSTTTERDRLDDSCADSGPLAAQLEELFSAIMTANDADGRPLHTVFQLLPSKKSYPEYYEVIESPIDLKMIATRIQQGEYGSLLELEKDVTLMVKNACQFNEPGSQIYKDAKSLKRVVTSKRSDIEHGRGAGSSSTTKAGKSERIRNRRLRSGLSHSAITAALQYEDDEGDEDEPMEEDEAEPDEEEEDDEDVGEEEEEEEDTKYSDIENPMWLLYESVCTHISSSGKVLSEPFRRLPSRRYYPDYYKEIRNPISLAQIQRRIQRGEYSNVTQVQTDMNVMFENAKTYNRPDSDLYKWAVKLQKVVQTKVQELLDNEDDSSNDQPPILTKGNTKVSDIGADIGNSDSPSTMDTSRESQKTPSSVGKKTAGKAKAVAVREATPLSTLAGISKGGKLDEKSKAEQKKELLKQRFTTIYKTLMETKESDGRLPVAVFMEKPSRKEYPDYYRIISDPIDMLTIEANIKYEKYNSTDELLKDFHRMFNNCRLFNEEGSLIYEDANKLEAILKSKIKELGPEPGKKKKVKKSPILVHKLNELLNTVKDHTDKSGRVLSAIFQKLPSKQLYPEYYEVIKNPIDLDRICHKVKVNAYDSLQHLLSDITLMLDNACKFNEPDSKIYKDALILQRLALQTKLSLAEDDDSVPDVPGAVKEILTSIFTSVYNHQDEEGRCYTDTMAELPEVEEIEGEKVRAISLDVIKSRLDRGLYKRLDKFQADMFLCFERARNLSRSDSQVFEDSVELQSFFIRSRDEICKSGSTLKSSAFAYTIQDLMSSVEVLKNEKKSKELPQEEDVVLSEVEPKKEEESSVAQSSQIESFNEQTYRVGDFVYISPSPNYNSSGTSDVSGDGNQTGGSSKSTGPKPNIANIQKLWTEPDGTKMFEGIWFFRPDQTYHIPTRKFLQKEVFRSEVRSTAQLSQILGKCWVMTVKNKEYFNSAPEGYAEEDVYVCEYRYSQRGRSFSKLKSWAFGSDHVKLVQREKVLEPIRVASVFRERVERHIEELQQMEDDVDKIPAEEFPNIELDINIPGKDGYIFYEQYSLPCGPIRAGDYVYVRVENAKRLIARVDTMWSESDEVTYFHGPWFTSLAEVSPTSIPPGRTFYKQEIFQSSIEDTNPLLSICGRCCVLDIEEYIKLRPTEFPEEDIYLCESMYEEARPQIKKFDGLQKIIHKDPRVHQDEIYFFRRPISLIRIDADGNVIPEMPVLKVLPKFESIGSPLAGIKSEFESMMEDSLDAPSLTSSDVGGSSVMPDTVKPTPTKKTKKTGSKVLTGYILYSAEVRKAVAEQNPDKSFGEISRMVGNDWRKKPALEKQSYEERAAQLNAQNKLRDAQNALKATAAASAEVNVTPSKTKTPAVHHDTDIITATSALKKDPDWIFECCWNGCDWQFEDALDLIEHCTEEPKGHVATTFKDSNSNDGEFQCKWKNCARLKKGVNPFPNLSRLLKHVKDIHILKGNGRIIHPDMRSSWKVMASRRNLPPAPTPKNKGKGQANQKPAVTHSAPIHNPPFANNMMNPNSTQHVSTPQPVVVQPPPVVRPVVVPPPEPLFVTVPPRPQKLVHSEAYVRYIESLHINAGEHRFMTNWENTLKATSKNTRVAEPDKLPAHWLANGPGNHGTSVEALWALRNFMMLDYLNLRKLSD